MGLRSCIYVRLASNDFGNHRQATDKRGAEVPGSDGNQVAISAEVKNEKEVKEGEKVLRSERYYGKVSRAFMLDQDVDETTSQAKYDNGVLELLLPKRSSSKSKMLTIQ